MTWITGPAAGLPRPDRIEFNRDIRPILSDKCFRCHGPDRNGRKADLRLDRRDSAMAVRDGHAALVPGDPRNSVLVRRITSDDPEERMPPPKAGSPLTERETALLKTWIEQGAEYQPHWSFIPPRRIPPPAAVREGAVVRNPIDAFILDRLGREGLEPAPEAGKGALLRRVTLDLTGLPPTPEQLGEFLAGTAPDAYERLVDRLLASPAFGERMAYWWLDAARYADTHGYQTDGDRHMWRWRDWVIGAFNRNLPFDQFTVDQIAGDLLPDATLEQRIATGFNRNHRGNSEGGIIPEEYAVEYVVDRVETTATVWLGLTLNCARCHDHKFDPVSQREFYQLFAFFNNVPEIGRATKYGNSRPYIPAPLPSQAMELAKIDERLARVRDTEYNEPALRRAQAEWEAAGARDTLLEWLPARALEAVFGLNGTVSNEVSHPTPRKALPATAASATVSTTPPTKAVSRPVGFVDGFQGQAATFDGGQFIDAGDAGNFGFYDPFTLALWVNPTETDRGALLTRSKDETEVEGYSVRLNHGRVQVNLVRRWLDDAVRVETDARLTPGIWQHLAVTYDGSREAGGVRIFFNGVPQTFRILVNELNQSFQSNEPLRIGGGIAAGSGFRGALDELRIYQRVLDEDEIAVLGVRESERAIAATPAARRTPEQSAKLRRCFVEAHAPGPIRQAHERVRSALEDRRKLLESFPNTMVMEERPAVREAFVLSRGQYDRPSEKVGRAVPASLHRMPDGAPLNRLGLARWLVDPANPLTGRVVVNHLWQLVFGTGLVKTAEDFGSQGEPPSHPELLDWLAATFVSPRAGPAGAGGMGWDVKALVRMMVTSATYRQVSRADEALWKRDPENRLLARGPRFRLPAELIRDQALAASGLLDLEVGGPSVKPYQPAGLWKDLASETNYEQSTGAALHRRSLYTFWKRTVAPPTMVAFDAPARETCIVRRSRTSTPLQALALMNDTTFLEASRFLARRILADGGGTDSQRIAFACQTLLARAPSPAELRVLAESIREHRRHFESDPRAARALASIGETPAGADADVTELSAFTLVAGTLLNLDETITKQ